MTLILNISRLISSEQLAEHVSILRPFLVLDQCDSSDEIFAYLETLNEVFSDLETFTKKRPTESDASRLSRCMSCFVGYTVSFELFLLHFLTFHNYVLVRETS